MMEQADQMRLRREIVRLAVLLPIVSTVQVGESIVQIREGFVTLASRFLQLQDTLVPITSEALCGWAAEGMFRYIIVMFMDNDVCCIVTVDEAEVFVHGFKMSGFEYRSFFNMFHQRHRRPRLFEPSVARVDWAREGF